MAAGGMYGDLADAGVDIFRAHGMGPLSKWVDDHIFFHILITYLQSYNNDRRTWNQKIEEGSGRIRDGSRIWYCGKVMPDRKPKEFDEDCSAVLREFPLSTDGATNLFYSYGDEEIDNLSYHLGILWEKSKTTPFGFSITYLGFTWNLED